MKSFRFKYEKAKFYVVDTTTGKYFCGFRKRKGIMRTIWCGYATHYPQFYNNEKSVIDAVNRIADMKGANIENYEIKDAQEYARSYWIMNMNSNAYWESSEVSLTIKQLRDSKYDNVVLKDDYISVLYMEQD